MYIYIYISYIYFRKCECLTWNAVFSFPESYTSAQGDHNPSLLVSPSLPITSCPLSSVPTSTQTKPHLLNPLSGRELTSQVPQPKARLKMNRESPQSIKTSSGSLSTGRTRLPHKQPSPVPSLISTKQKKVSRRRATNGWRPVGLPTEKEVFIAVGYLCVYKIIAYRLETTISGFVFCFFLFFFVTIPYKKDIDKRVSFLKIQFKI